MLKMKKGSQRSARPPHVMEGRLLHTAPAACHHLQRLVLQDFGGGIHLFRITILARNLAIDLPGDDSTGLPMSITLAGSALNLNGKEECTPGGGPFGILVAGETKGDPQQLVVLGLGP